MPVTSQQIMSAIEFVNPKTLVRWHQKKLIPPPDIQMHPNGNGRISYWPDWVLEHCRYIKKAAEGGIRHSELAREFNEDWEEVKKRYVTSKLGHAEGGNSPTSKRRYILSVESARLERQEFRYVLSKTIDTLIAGNYPDLRVQLNKATIRDNTDALVHQALDLLKQGITPVLLISARSSLVTPDFSIGPLIADAIDLKEPFVVVPLIDMILDTHIHVQRPWAPRFSPSHCAEMQTKARTMRREFSMDENCHVVWEDEEPSSGARKTKRRRR